MEDAYAFLAQRVTVDPDTGCWLWSRCLNGVGYGVFRQNRRTHLAHRFAYELYIGPIPPKHHIDHLCRVRRCVNPHHLEAVTPGENTARTTAAETTRRRHAAKMQCPRGHLYSPENTRYYLKQGYTCRACRACEADHSRETNSQHWKGLWRWGDGKHPERRKRPA